MQLAKHDFLAVLRNEADLAATVSDNVRRLVAVGRSAGISGAELARASRLSKAAVAEIALTSGRLAGQTLELDEAVAVLAWVRNVTIVPAAVGYREYRTYSAYICQNRRRFSSEMTRFAFYADREVKPESPEILDVAHDVVFTQETADRLRDEGRAELAQIVERVVADGARNGTDPHSIYALSPARDEAGRTIRLDAPIRHITSGPGSGFVQRQRYVSEQALQAAAGKTTRELLEADGQ